MTSGGEEDRGRSASSWVAWKPKRLLASGIHLGECFGPAAVVVEYDDPAQLTDFVRRLGAKLTATVHGEPDDDVAATPVPLWPTGRAG